MTLKERYSIENNVSLISMIDDKEVYTETCINVLKEIIKERKLTLDEIKSLATETHFQKARQQYLRLDPLNDDIRIFESEYLDAEELNEIYRVALSQYMKDREGFRYNVWFNKLKKDL